MLGVLREEGLAFSYEPVLADAVRRTLEGNATEDLVLLLGAQGMDHAAELTKGLLG